MNKTRSGQGLSVNMIILIALGIVILVIAILMFRNSTQKGQEAAGNCELLGGMCKSAPGYENNPSADPCAPESRAFGNCKDPQNTVCCSKPAGSDVTDKTRQ